MKYGLGPRTEVFLGWSPYVVVDAPGDDEDGVGDVVVGARHRVREASGEEPSAAWQLAVKLPSDDEADALTSGEPDGFGAGILTGAVDERTSWTAFWQLGLLGAEEGGADVQHGLALAVARLLDDDHVGAFAEVAAVVTPEADDEQVFTTLGATLAPRDWLVLDAFVVLGLSDDAPDFALGVGWTQNVGGAPFRTD